mmetsp:Transcript_86087/g.240898  ORF Transcript_86087/g.240898 Transcript_86087/m.240898 type:complete len:176 (+) Transcript_86087:82-609(+)
MSRRPLARLPLLAWPRRQQLGARFRLAPEKDDLGRRGPNRGRWAPGLGDLEGDGVDESVLETSGASGGDPAPSWGEAEPEDVPPVWAPVGQGTACYEETYGTPSKTKWRTHFHGRGGTLHTPATRATAPASVAELVASGQPKEEIYRAIREAYDVDSATSSGVNATGETRGPSRK